jgi:hypothetical protein
MKHRSQRGSSIHGCSQARPQIHRSGWRRGIPSIRTAPTRATTTGSGRSTIRWSGPSTRCSLPRCRAQDAPSRIPHLVNVWMTESLDRKSSPSCGAEGRRHLREYRVEASNSSRLEIDGSTGTWPLHADARLHGLMPPAATQQVRRHWPVCVVAHYACRARQTADHREQGSLCVGSRAQGYLLWMRGATLVAQELDPRALRLVGEPQVIVEALNGTSESDIHVAASATGPPLSFPRASNSRSRAGSVRSSENRSTKVCSPP